MKRCEAMLLRIDGEYEQCDNLAQAPFDYCWECQQLGNTRDSDKKEEWNEKS